MQDPIKLIEENYFKKKFKGYHYHHNKGEIIAEKELLLLENKCDT